MTEVTTLLIVLLSNVNQPPNRRLGINWLNDIPEKIRERKVFVKVLVLVLPILLKKSISKNIANTFE